MESKEIEKIKKVLLGMIRLRDELDEKIKEQRKILREATLDKIWQEKVKSKD